MTIGEQTFWYLEVGEKSKSEASLFNIPLLLENPPLPLVVGLTRHESWRRSLDVGDESVTGGMSPELSCGGGCCHWGSGPASRRVCSSGPASITACRNLPCSGRAFLIATLSAASGGGGFSIVSGRLSLQTGELSSQSDDERALLSLSSLLVVVALEIGHSRVCFEECAWIWACWKSNCFSITSCWHFVSNSSLSFMILPNNPLSWMISSSFLEISSWAEITAASSSRVEYRSECFSSSTPYTQYKRKKKKTTQYPTCKKKKHKRTRITQIERSNSVPLLESNKPS